MDWITFLSGLIGGLGLGSMLGVLVKYFLDVSLENKKLIFQERFKIYTKVIHLVWNLGIPLGSTKPEDLKDHRIIKEFDSVITACKIIGSKKLIQLLEEVEPHWGKWHEDAIREDGHINSEKEAQDLILSMRHILDSVPKVTEQMRKDLKTD